MPWQRRPSPPFPPYPARLEALGPQETQDKRANMADEERKEEQEAKVEEEAKGEEKAEEKQEQPEKQLEQEMIRSIVLTGYGSYNKLQVQKFAKPKPTNGHVVVRVHAW